MLPVTLLLFTASLAVPAGLFGFMAWQSHEEAFADARSRVEQTTGILHEHALKVFEINAGALDRTAQYVAASPDRSAPHYPARLHDFLAQVEQSSPSIQSLWVFAPDGTGVATSRPVPPPRGPLVPDRDYFVHQRTHPGNAYFVSGPMVGRTDREPQFVLTRRLQDADGAFLGVVTSAMYAGYFTRHWLALSPQLAPSAALVRDDGVILVRYPGLPAPTAPLTAGPEYMQAVLQGSEGIRQMGSAIDGRQRIVGFRRLAGYPVSIAYAVSLDAVMAGWYHQLALYGAVCGSAALALLAMTALVHRRYRSEERLVEQLRDTDAARTRLFANVSHELRTPLALILGPVQRLLKACPSSGEEHHELEVIERSAQALLRRVNDLLDMARLEAGSARLEYARVDLAQLVRMVCACFESAGRDTGVALEVDTPPELPAQVDAPKAERILFNLLSNAFKFTPPPGRVRVALAARDGQAWISVQDTGPGVPPHQRQAVFERFRQGSEPAGRSPGGTGLGLAIVREFAQLHGGSVALEDAPGGGALFRVRLPLRAPPGATVLDAPESALPHAALVPEPRGASSAPPRPGVGADRPRVLVVEDHPDMNAFIAGALARRYRVETARDGQEGLEVALRAPAPDLVVADMMMPLLDGEALLECLRREPTLRDVPVLMLTARADDALQARVLRKGAQDFLQKPFSEEVLLERVARLLADREHAAALVRRSEQRLRAILETAQDAIIVADGEQRIVLFNGAAQRMFGYPPETVIGEGLTLLIPGDCWANCGIQTGARQAGACATGEARRASGELFPVECSMSRLDEGGTFYTVILRDITARLHDRQALVEAHEELHRVTQGFQRELIAAVEARQARIARDLHDSVGASLAGVSLLVGAARGLAADTRAKAVLDKAQEQVATTADAVRGISRGLMPAGTDSGGLLHALEQFASDLSDTSGIECTVRARGAFTGFDAEIATHVFRIVQEAAANAIRHGNATVLRIVLCEGRERWRVSVTDDGSGCDFDHLPRAHPGLGLRSMQARARAIGGELQLAAAGPEGGCRVRVTWHSRRAQGR
ncbi:ATP-binding protein [Ramlibacter sp. AN1133]|uniref:ATP-binding protein n=1 Tax=Ramlibacter sp. AN1133 TaxID=3133429 RepID=UPI0030C5DC28